MMKECKNRCNLSDCFLCRHSMNDWIPAIGAHKTNFEVKKGQQIFKEGDEVKGIFFVFSGKVKVHKRWDAEKELILRFAKQGDIIGHLGLGDEPLYPISTTAIENTVLCFVELAFFESSLNVNSKLTLSLMRFFANELQESEKRMRNLVHMPVKERIALSLLNLQKQFGLNADGAINLEITRQDFSSYAAVSYETLFKVTNEFIQNNLIAATGKSFTILNEAELKRMALEVKDV